MRVETLMMRMRLVLAVAALVPSRLLRRRAERFHAEFICAKCRQWSPGGFQWQAVDS